ncbi:TonB-dependent receptor [Sphingobium sp. H39-3-25]|uniref:TonB-dependent receptor domain-containing protein n=1 Tax=Sphingobium arseniciresistens TaxID=3030834 RepID=UPI0023B914F4|nr:TonB-dependent receptor [Sphingobium arseniciresistens]
MSRFLLQRLYIAQASIVALTACVCGQAQAVAAEALAINIPTQPMSDALQSFSKQTGYRLLFPSRMVAGYRSRSLAGALSAEDALARLLAGTPLKIASIRGKVVALASRGEEQALRLRNHGGAPIQLAALQSGAALTSEAAPSEEEEPADNEIVVVGSQIRGAKTTAALPVTVVGEEEIAATAAVSGDELFRSIPQMGDVTFNSAYIPNSSNSPRGDVGSVNLRNLGVGNTLVLLNGRRVVTHPASTADDNLVPVLTYNTNAIPVSGVKRLEVLRDGAGAIYGSDAVAGVVNTVLQDDYEGASLETQYGLAEGTHMREFNVNGLIGTGFASGRGNITIFGDYTERNSLLAGDQAYTASADRRPLFAGTDFASAGSLDGRSTTTAWGYFQAAGVSRAIQQNGTALTSAAGYFHVQPQNFAGCQAGIGNGLCIDDGAIATAGADRELRYDTPRATNSTVMPGVKRGNIFATAHYELTPDVELFGEAGLYLARTVGVQSASGTLSSVPITVPASNYWNPFGPTLLNGAPNPNRLAGLTNVPASGLPVIIRTMAFADTGRNVVVDKNSQFRLLGGIRFKLGGFDWESAALYSEAKVTDRSDGISVTGLQQALALSTPDAYNPFNGSSLTDTSGLDTVGSSPVAIQTMRIKTTRASKSTLALADIKGSRADLIALPGGDLGMALGAEIRRETQLDDRDPRVDGTIGFTDSVTGAFYPSDLMGTSPSPDVYGKRTVFSSWAELAVPVISQDMNIPLVHKLEMQIAGRFEHYSDVGSVAKPKFAAAWDVVDGIRLRGSYAENFKAPNLEQINTTVVTRANSRTDWVRCEADLRAGRISSFAGCSQATTVSVQRSGNPDLKPETSRAFGGGIVLEPRFIPARFGRLTLTADYWNIKQKGVVGLFGEGNALILDYMMRLQGGSNPNVIRAAPTSDDIAAFNNTGIAPVGQVLYTLDQYVNLLPQKVAGWDFGLNYTLRGTRIGDFNLALNLAYLDKFYRSPSAGIAELLAARAAGTINRGTTITGGGDLVRLGGKPRWKASGTLTWTSGPVQIGGYTQYTGSVLDDTLLDGAGNAWTVDDTLTFNLYAQVEIKNATAGAMRLRVGARNLTNEKPPLSAAGYLASVYNPYARYWYINARVSF